MPVNATLSALDRAGAAEQAARARAAGFECLKVKVGSGDDFGRVAAVRAAAGPEARLRLDANGAWDVDQAVHSIEALAPAGLELVEEPVHGLHEMRAVRERVAVRVAIDETASERGALGGGIADAVCLKLSRCGGIGALVAAAALVRASGAEVYLASTLDGPLGVAAALHAAAALASRGPLPHCGLATLELFEDIENPLPARDGAIDAALRPRARRRAGGAALARRRPRPGPPAASTCPPSSTVSRAVGDRLRGAPGDRDVLARRARPPAARRASRSSPRRPQSGSIAPAPEPAHRRRERARLVAAHQRARVRGDVRRVVGEQRLACASRR